MNRKPSLSFLTFRAICRVLVRLLIPVAVVTCGLAFGLIAHLIY